MSCNLNWKYKSFKNTLECICKSFVVEETLNWTSINLPLNLQETKNLRQNIFFDYKNFQEAKHLPSSVFLQFCSCSAITAKGSFNWLKSWVCSKGALRNETQKKMTSLSNTKKQKKLLEGSCFMIGNECGLFIFSE